MASKIELVTLRKNPNDKHRPKTGKRAAIVTIGIGTSRYMVGAKVGIFGLDAGRPVLEVEADSEEHARAILESEAEQRKLGRVFERGTLLERGRAMLQAEGAAVKKHTSLKKGRRKQNRETTKDKVDRVKDVLEQWRSKALTFATREKLYEEIPTILHENGLPIWPKKKGDPPMPISSVQRFIRENGISVPDGLIRRRLIE